MNIFKCIRLFILPLAGFLSSCTKELELPQAEPKIVLLGELVADESVYFRGGKSTALRTGSGTTLELVNNLDISIKGPGGITWPLQSEEDDVSSSEYTLAFFSDQKPQPSGTYSVTATHPSLGVATANVFVPAAFNASVDTSSASYLNYACLKANITVQDDGSTENFYCIEVVQQPFIVEAAFFYNGEWLRTSEHTDLYDSLLNAGVDLEERLDTFYMNMRPRVQLFASETLAEHVKNGKADREVNRMLVDDKSFGGGTKTFSIYIPRKNILPSDPGLFGYTTFIQVKSISADYFSYLKAYEEVDHNFTFDEFNNKTRIEGNVKNGLGMIGGVFRRQFGYGL